jgi:hypothetical protein
MTKKIDKKQTLENLFGKFFQIPPAIGLIEPLPPS